MVVREHVLQDHLPSNPEGPVQKDPGDDQYQDENRHPMTGQEETDPIQPRELAACFHSPAFRQTLIVGYLDRQT
jgi:hypothetical protein